MTKKTIFLLFYTLLILSPLLHSQDKKVIVVADKATIYAEANDKSHVIESVKRGTVLSLFIQAKEDTEWLYITFYSKRYKGKATGFIRPSMVVYGEQIPEKLPIEEEKPREDVSQPEGDEEQEPGELPSLEKAFAPKEAEVKKEKEKKPVEALEVPVEQKTEITAPEKQVLEKTEEEPKPEIAPEEKIEPEAERPLPVEQIPEKAEKEEILETLPQAQEVATPPIKVGKEEEFKRDEVFPKPEIKTTIKPMDVPESRTISEPVSEETEEPRAFAVIQRESPTPLPRDVKAQAKIPEERPQEEEPFKIKIEEPEPEKEAVESPKEETPPPPPAKIKVEKVEEVKEEVKPEETAEETDPEIKPQTIEEVKREPESEILPQSEEEIPEKAGEKVPEKAETKEKKPAREDPEEEPQVIKSPEQVVPPKDIIGQAAPFPKQSLFTMGFGYGPSLGGLGTFVQFNTKSGFSLHVGAGYYPATAYYSQYDWLKNEMLYSVGIKYYLPFGNHKLHPYIDVQYGGISVEAVQVVSEIWYGDYVYENIQKTLYGPSVLGGIELKAGVLGINAALGLTYNTTEWGYWDQDLFINGDFGVVIYF